MKKRILFTFLIVLLINLIIGFLLYKSYLLSLTETVVLLLGSYLVYGIFNLYLYIQLCIKNNLNYCITLIIGTVVCIIVLIILIVNLRDDKFLFVPMMYVISMLCTFLNWNIADKKVNSVN